MLSDVGIFSSKMPISIDAAFLNSVNYKAFNVAYNVDCMVQVQEAKTLGLIGELNPKIEILH